MNRILYGLLAALFFVAPVLAQNLGPFTPLQASATVGKTVKVTGNATPTSVASTLVCTAILRCNNIRILNAGTVLVFVRVTAETTPTATAADIPLAAGQTIIIPSGAPEATVGVAVLSSTTTAADVYFTPGQGGL